MPVHEPAAPFPETPTGTSGGKRGHRAETAEPFRMGKRELLLVFGFWTFFAALTVASRLGDGIHPAGTPRPFAEAFFWTLTAYMWAAVTPLVFWLVWRLHPDRFGWATRVLLFLVVGVAVAVAMTAASDKLFVDVLGFPRFRGGTAPAIPLLRSPWLLNNLITFTGILAAGFARQYFFQLRARQEEAVRLQAHAVELQAQLAEARLAVLRTQLNPHFLFNTLNAVSALVARDPKGVRRMIARLSDLLRYALNESQEQEIPVRDELKLLERYLEILELRYQGRLQTQMAADPEVLDALVPNLILQPLAENAMNHAIELAGGYGRIEVSARRSGDDLVLRVRDTGPGEGGAAAALDGNAGTGLGLRHTRARLEELYGSHQRLELRPAPDGGMIAEVRVPLRLRADAAALPDPTRTTDAAHA